MSIAKATKVLMSDGGGGNFYENKEKQVITPTPVIPESTRTKIGLVDSEGNVYYYNPRPTPKPTPTPTPTPIPTPTPTPTPTPIPTPIPTPTPTTKSTHTNDKIVGDPKAFEGMVIEELSTPTPKGEVEPAINAALGTPDYTWQQDAAKRAGTQLSKDVETTRKEFLESRKQLDQAAQQGQDQYSMSKYTLNQSIEKAGWAGGYVLDAQRQTEYLKQSIKAQMYGQMELQAMGYDSQLAAARLAYDLGKQDLARQYYQDAVANQVQKAQLTGVWISPEVNDMLTQSQAASAILAKKEGLSDEEKLLDKEYQQARHLKDQIVNWFAETGLSETGIDTLAKMTFNLDVQAFNEAKIQATLETIEPSQYVKKNADGSYKINDATGKPEIIDLNVASPDEQWDFFNTDYGHIALRNQVNNLALQTMQNFINNTPGLSDMSDSQFQTAFDNYLAKGTNDLVKDYVNQFGSNDIMQRLINTHPEVFVDGQYSYSLKSGDNTYTYKFKKTTGTGETTDADNNGIDDQIDQKIFDNPEIAITQIPDPLGFSTYTLEDLMSIYRGSQGEATTQYARDMYAIDAFLNGDSYTQEQAEIAMDAMVKLYSYQSRHEADLDPYKQNQYKENAYVLDQVWKAFLKTTDYDPEDFEWDWDIEIGTDAVPGIKSSSLSDSEKEFLTSIGFNEVERGRLFFGLNGSGTKYYAIGASDSSANTTGLNFAHNWYTKAILAYMKKNAADVNNK